MNSNCNDIQNYSSTGLSVRLLYRTEETIQQFKDRVELVKGDVTNPNDVEETLKGVDGVCVTLGTRNKLEPTTVMSTGLTNIVQGNFPRFRLYKATPKIRGKFLSKFVRICFYSLN